MRPLIWWIVFTKIEIYVHGRNILISMFLPVHYDFELKMSKICFILIFFRISQLRVSLGVFSDSMQIVSMHEVVNFHTFLYIILECSSNRNIECLTLLATTKTDLETTLCIIVS